jgi:hypothetical protein
MVADLRDLAAGNDQPAQILAQLADEAPAYRAALDDDLGKQFDDEVHCGQRTVAWVAHYIGAVASGHTASIPVTISCANRLPGLVEAEDDDLAERRE